MSKKGTSCKINSPSARSLFLLIHFDPCPKDEMEGKLDVWYTYEMKLRMAKTLIKLTSPGLRSSVALCSARSGGERDLTADCWDCCCFSCCNLLNLFSASVSFCCSLSNCARCSSWMTSSFSLNTTICRGNWRRNTTGQNWPIVNSPYNIDILLSRKVKRITEMITELGGNAVLYTIQPI